MRSLPSGFSTFLANGRNVRCADLWSFTLASGQTLYWSGGDRGFNHNGNVYVLGPGLARGKVRWSLSLDVDSMEVTITPRASDLIGSTPLALAIRRGDFDYAGVRLSRAYGVALDGSIAGGVIDNYFVGRVGPVEGDGMEYRLSIVSPMEALDQPFPRNVVQAQCLNRLFDDICSLNADSFRFTGAVTGGVSAPRHSFQTTLTREDTYFTLGRFRWLTGANAGRSQTVRKHVQSGGALWFPMGWPEVIATGDTFEIWPGCDKSAVKFNPATGKNEMTGACKVKFDNVAHFRGFPLVPAPETTT